MSCCSLRTLVITIIMCCCIAVPVSDACNAYTQRCPSHQCCLLLVKLKFKENFVWSKCVKPRLWHKDRCTKSDNFCAQTSDCNENQVCRGATYKNWGTCHSGCLNWKKVKK